MSLIKNKSGRAKYTRLEVKKGFPCGSAGKESACNVGDLGSIPGLGRFPWRKERLPTPVFWPGEFHGLYSPWGPKESDMTERLSLHRSKKRDRTNRECGLKR